MNSDSEGAYENQQLFLLAVSNFGFGKRDNDKKYFTQVIFLSSRFAM